VSVSSDGGADAIRVANPARAKSAKNSDSTGFVANAVNNTEDLSCKEELLETSDSSMETQRARKPECTVTRATSGRHATVAPAISCMGHLSATTRAAAGHHSQTTCDAVNRQRTAPGNAYPEDTEGNEICFSSRNRSTCGIDSCQRRLGIARGSDSARAVLDWFVYVNRSSWPGDWKRKQLQTGRRSFTCGCQS
jgi:hypothetical protein